MRFNGSMPDVPLTIPDLELVPFTVTAEYENFPGRRYGDAGNDQFPVSGTVIFTPSIGGLIRTKSNTGVSCGGFMLQCVQGVIVNGVLTRFGRPGVKLVANGAILNLDNLFYRVTYKGLKASDGSALDLEPFSFEAPTSNAVLDLSTVAPDPVLG